VKVVITDHRFPNVEQEQRAVEEAGGKLVVAQITDEDQLAELCKDADGVLTVRAPITRRVIEAMQRCRIIVRYGIGIDSVDIPAATERGIMVANVPDYCIDEVSDQALTLLLMLSRHFACQTRTLVNLEDAEFAPPAWTDLRPGRLRQNRIASRRQSRGARHAHPDLRSLLE